MRGAAEARPLDVVHVIDTLRLGGAERVMADLVRGLDAAGVAVGVCTTRPTDGEALSLPPGVPLLRLERRRTWDLGAVRAFARWCRARRVRVIHAHGRNTARFCAFARLAGPLPRPRLVVHDHYGPIDVDPSAPLGVRLALRLAADRYVGVGPALAAWAVERAGMAPRRVLSLPNRIDLSRFRSAAPLPREPLAGGRPVLAAVVANLRPQKDHPLLFRALAASRVARARMRVLVVGRDFGDAHGRACREMVEALGLEEAVSFLGARGDVPRLLRTADWGLLPSRSESGPLTLLECMAAGTPFLATRTGEIAASVEARGFGRFVAPGDEAALAGALDALCEVSGEARAAEGAYGAALAAAHYDIPPAVEALRGLYAGLGVAAAGPVAALAAG